MHDKEDDVENLLVWILIALGTICVVSVIVLSVLVCCGSKFGWQNFNVIDY